MQIGVARSSDLCRGRKGGEGQDGEQGHWEEDLRREQDVGSSHQKMLKMPVSVHQDRRMQQVGLKKINQF